MNDGADPAVWLSHADLSTNSTINSRGFRTSVHCLTECGCVCRQKTRLFAVLAARKSPRNSSLLGLMNSYSSKDAYRIGRVFCRVLWPWFLIAARPRRGIEHYGNWVVSSRPRRALRERWRKCQQIGSPCSKRQELGCGTESRSIPAQSKANNLLSFHRMTVLHAEPFNRLTCSSLRTDLHPVVSSVLHLRSRTQLVQRITKLRAVYV